MIRQRTRSRNSCTLRSCCRCNASICLYRNMLLRPRTPAVYEARGWVPGPGQFAAPPPKATKHSPPTEKGLPGRNHRGQEAAEGRAAGPQFSNRVPGSQPGRTNGSEDGLSEADEPQFWELPPTTAPVGAPAKKAQLSVRPAEPRLDEEARARARRLEKERQILADHVKFRDWEERVRQQRAEAERAEAAARRGRAKAGKKGGEKPAPRRGETNPADFDDSPPFARFFVAIGNSKEDVENSVEHSAWTSVTRTGNRKLDMAFRKLREGEGAGPLYLFLTVNASGVFCGVAEMVRKRGRAYRYNLKLKSLTLQRLYLFELDSCFLSKDSGHVKVKLPLSEDTQQACTWNESKRFLGSGCIPINHFKWILGAIV